MSKTIFIKLTKYGRTSGPFTIYDDAANIIATNVTKESLIKGHAFFVNDSVQRVRIVSTGDCEKQIVIKLQEYDDIEFYNTETTMSSTACLWRHLKNPKIYNTFYGKTCPYIIEHPFAFQYQDEILQNVKDYSKVYKYYDDEQGVTNEVNKVALDDVWYNKAILYNDQQSSGTLFLTSKPRHNLQKYVSYPLYKENGKTIIYTKSDNFYQYNTFWNVAKTKTSPLFKRSCESLSVDKIINDDNMDYSYRSFNKAPLRAKDLKIRHMLTDRDDVHIVSMFIVAPSQISYK